MDNTDMRIGILSRNPALYSTRRLAQAIWARGHQAQIIDTTSVAVHLGAADTPPGATHLLTGGAVGLAATTPLPPIQTNPLWSTWMPWFDCGHS